MKKICAFIFLFTFSLSIFALPPSVEADRLLLQAKAALDAKDYAQATESLTKAEKLGIKLPATFYYHYGRAYSGTGNLEQGRAMLDRYLSLSGTKGKFYQEALVEMNNIEAATKKRDADKEAAINKMEAEKEAARIGFNAQLVQYEKSVANCPNVFREIADSLEKDSLVALEKCQRRSYCNPEYDSDFVEKRKKFLFFRRDGYEIFCNDRYSKPEMPASLR